MIKIPAKIRYAIRTLVELGTSKLDITPLKIIEQTQGISAKFAKQIMQPLEKNDLVKSKRGIYGGYYLNKKPSEISFKLILESFKRENNIIFCMNDRETCPRESVCGSKLIWNELQEKIDHFFATTTIQNIIDKEMNI